MNVRAPREQGRHYTPAELARRIVRSGVAAAEERRGAKPLRILDPACGEGGFLLPVFDELNARNLEAGSKDGQWQLCGSNDRLELVRTQIYGCDIDPNAIFSLRSSLLERIGARGELALEAEKVVEANLQIGDALTGADFGLVAEGSHDATESGPSPGNVPPIDWTDCFSSVASAGGFDLIVGNPPYVRERDARELFERIARTSLGRRWREARMDLWYYFAHRALDLLRPGGVLTFVVNSYWTASRGARKLIGRFERETQLDEIELLGTQKIFDGVAGRHLVFRARKVAGESSGATNPAAADKAICTIRSGDAPPYSVPHVDLYQSGRLVLALPVELDSPTIATRPLAELFQTRQGIAENPHSINRRLMRTFEGDFTLGDGVFVLRPEEVARLQFSEAERALLRPYYDTSAIGSYLLPGNPTHQLLYLTRRTAPSLDGLPGIQRHLERFRSILERRRETREGTIAWWHLHWPREEAHFINPRVLSVQMGRKPQFVYASQPTFVGFSVNLVLAGTDCPISLSALAGILNSECARQWFDRHGKRRGVNLEINAHVLRQFPLPISNPQFDREIAGCVARRQSLPAESPAAEGLVAEIDQLTRRWYRLPEVTSAAGRTSSTP